MTSQMISNQTRFANTILALSLVLSAVAVQAKDPGDKAADKLLGLGGAPLSERAVARLVARALPEWDKSIVDVAEVESPVDSIGFKDVLALAGDDAGFADEPPEGATQVSDDDHAIKIVPRKGKLRYVNRKRAWNVADDGQTRPVSKRKAFDIAVQTLAGLGIDRSALGRADIQIQRAVGAKAGSRKPTEQYDMYRLVKMQRQINKIPVYDAGFKVAINNRGEIQRMGLDWPAFKLSEERALRGKRSVVMDATKQIMEESPNSNMKINSTLAYAVVNGEAYKPVLVISVTARPTPYQLFVELTLPDKPDAEEN